MFPEQATTVVTWLTERFVPERFRDQVFDITCRFLGGLESLRSPQEALMVFVTSVVIWLFETGKYWFVMHPQGNM